MRRKSKATRGSGPTTTIASKQPQPKPASVRASRDGDQFHYHWAARQCLRLLSRTTDLVAVTIEGPSTAESASDAITQGEELIDVGFYYGAEKRDQARLVHYVQLKHSTRHANDAWTAGGLKKTLEGFAQRYLELVVRFSADQVALRFRFEFASNRPITSNVKEALADLASGAAARHQEEHGYLAQCSGLTGAQLQQFFSLITVTGGEGDLWEQRHRLTQDFRQYLAGADSEAPLELKDLVARKATTEFEANPSIRRHDVLRALKVGEEDLAPAPRLVPEPNGTLPREQEQEILRTLLDATTPVVIHAHGGVGKSVLAARLAASLPSSSAAVLYDCFGNGLYRSALGLRHRYRDALVQIANELAARGLCYPLVPTERADARQYMPAFLGRLTQAIASLRAADPNANLCVIIDAADNAEMAAEEWNEPGSFVRELIRMQLPDGVRIAFTCRSHRRSLLHAPPEVHDVELRPFSEAESANHLRSVYPDAQDDDVSEFAFLTSSNPRVQALALAESTSLDTVLKRLGPEPTTVDSAIEQLLNTAIARLKDASIAVEAPQIDTICRGLAAFRPLVPVSVLAKMSGASEGAIRSFVLDMGRPLLLKGDSVHFLDEPTETWFRERLTRPERFGAEEAEFATFVERLRPLAAENAYAAGALPQLLLWLRRYDELVELALSDASLPNGNPLERRDVKVQRLRFALKACIQTGNYASAGKIALKAAGECAGEQRQNQVIKDHTDVAGVLMAPDRIEALVARRTFGDSWRGSHYAYEATLMSGSEELVAEASSRLRMAKDWLRAWAHQPQDQRRDREHVTDKDVAEIAQAMLRLEGPNAAANFLKGWTPRSVSFRVGRIVGRRLIDLGEYDRLDKLALAGKRDPWLLLALCVEVNAVGRQPPADALARLLRVLGRPNVTLPDPGGDESWRILEGVRCAIELALRALPHEPEVWAEVLRRYLPSAPPDSISMRYGPDRARLWRAYALEAALRGERLSIEAISPAQLRARKATGGEHQLFLAEARGLLPWLILSAEIACGRHPPNASEAIQNALKETIGAERGFYQEQKPVRQQVAFEWFRILRSTPAITDEHTDTLSSWLFEQEPSLPDGTVIALCRLAARCDGFERLAMRLGEHAYTALDASRKNAQSRADSLLELARGVLSVSRDEARAYFDRAVEISSRIGDENLERWVALLDLATSAAEPGRPRPRTAYRLSRVAELTYEYVERDKHFPWNSTAEALADLCAASSLAILSRWRDRRFGDKDRLLAAVVNRLVAKNLLPERTPIALAGTTAWWHRADDLKRALLTESDPQARPILAKVAYRYIRVEPSKTMIWKPPEAETWTTLRELKDRYSLEMPDFERLSRRASASKRNDDASSSKPGELNRPDWNEIFRDVDLGDSAALHARFTEARKHGPPYNKEPFFREALRRVKAGREPEFIRALAAWPGFGFFDLKDLLRTLPSPIPNQLALRSEVRTLVLSVCRREPHMCQRRGLFETAPIDVLCAGGLLSYKEIATDALDGVAEQVDVLDASKLFQSIGPLALVLSPGEAEEVLDFGFDLLEAILKPEDGDGEWREELRPQGSLIDALAGYIWAGLGSAAAPERWQHAHVVRTVVEMGWTELLQAVIAKADSDMRAFIDRRCAFYGWHACQWVLIGLARGALENAKGVRPAHALLLKSVDTRHVLIRELAAQTLRTLVAQGELDASTIGNLSVNQPKEVLVDYGNLTFDDEPADSNTSTKDEHYLFGFDIGPYWFEPLGRTFGLTQRAIERRARKVMKHTLGWSGSLERSEDGRRKLLEDGEDICWQGSLPRADGILSYLAYHAMMVIAADLLAERPARRYKDRRTNEFVDWITRFTLTRSDGRWLADSRAPRLCPAAGLRQENWRWGVTASYLDQQLTTDDGLRVVYGEWYNGETGSYETISIRSALVTTAGAASLLAALQTAEKFNRFALPHATDAGSRAAHDGHNEDGKDPGVHALQEAELGDDDDDKHDYDAIDVSDDGGFDAGPLKLIGWVTHQRAEAHLDEYDPWGDGMPFPGPAPSQEVVSKLALRWREDGNVWETPGGGVLRTERSVQVRVGERRDETLPGEHLSANRGFLRELLAAYSDCTLIVCVEVRRHPSRYEREAEDFDSSPQPYVRYYLMGADGVATPL